MTPLSTEVSVCIFEQADLLDCALRPFLDLLGAGVLTMFLAGPFSIALWIQSRNIYIVAALLAMFVSLVIAGLPPIWSVAAYCFVALALTLGLRSIADEVR